MLASLGAVPHNEMMAHLEQHPILAWFVASELTTGDAPVAIKEQWIGVPLPVRELADSSMVHFGRQVLESTDSNIVEDPVFVFTIDAVKALKLFGREEAADFWEQSVDGDKKLIFEESRGKLYQPDELNAYLPGLVEFDSIRPEK